MSAVQRGGRPIVGIMCCNEFVERPVQTVATRFIKPLARLCGVSPLLVPAVADGGDLEALVNVLDGLLLTGSRSNVEPQRTAEWALLNRPTGCATRWRCHCRIV